MAQIGLADNYIRRLSITSSLAAGAAAGGDVWPVEGEEDTRPPVVYKNTFGGRMSKKFAATWFGRFFDLEHRRTILTAEVRAGVVGFLTICYIVAVNPAILADTGGPCTPADCTGPNKGTPACKFDGDLGYQQCVINVKRSLVATTCICSAIGCFMMAFLGNMPLAIAPGMGINAYFSYQVVGYHGSGAVSYQQALALVFVEGLFFILISVTGLRGRLIELVPKHIMLATSCGIGLFLAHIGLQSAEGIGLVTADGATIVSLGGCPHANRVPYYFIKDPSAEAICVPGPDGAMTANLGPKSSNYGCKGKRMHSPTMMLGIWSAGLIIVLMHYEIKAAIMFGVVFATAISWIPGSSVSYLSDSGDIPGGAERFEFFKKVVDLPNPSKTAGLLDFSFVRNGQAWVAFLTLIYLDFLDATGTLFTMARLINENVPNFVDDAARFPRRLVTLCIDGVCIVIGALLGTSPLTVVAESSVAIKEGGRTGVTAFCLGMGFVIAMFFAPLFASIPPYATGPALIVVGTLIIGHAREIDWDDLRVAFPAFVTIVLMPLTYSIAYGVLGGILVNIALWLILGITDACLAAYRRCRGDLKGPSPGDVVSDMFQCWRNAFSDYFPGLKAEWKGCFDNRLIDRPSKRGLDKSAGSLGKALEFEADEVAEASTARRASANGDWLFLAVNDDLREGAGLEPRGPLSQRSDRSRRSSSTFGLAAAVRGGHSTLADRHGHGGAGGGGRAVSSAALRRRAQAARASSNAGAGSMSSAPSAAAAAAGGHNNNNGPAPGDPSAHDGAVGGPAV